MLSEENETMPDATTDDEPPRQTRRDLIGRGNRALAEVDDD